MVELHIFRAMTGTACSVSLGKLFFLNFCWGNLGKSHLLTKIILIASCGPKERVSWPCVSHRHSTYPSFTGIILGSVILTAKISKEDLQLFEGGDGHRAGEPGAARPPGLLGQGGYILASLCATQQGRTEAGIAHLFKPSLK